ncbi:MAG TPA: response regulator transcription factor [Pseudonocardiaceae bacterium]|jgi:DNA-binding NarL/FixJ family response regulator|nr:response regulator transcription factor [Pseudonocardiaceae bacterium]
MWRNGHSGDAVHRAHPLGPHRAPLVPVRGEPLGVLVVDQVPLFREGLAQRLRNQPGLNLLGSIGHPQGAVELCERVRPDVVVVDAVLDPHAHLVNLLARGNAGLTALMLVREPYRHARFVSAMQAAGVHGLILRSAPGDQVTEAIRRVHTDRRYLGPTLARVAGPAEPAPPPGPRARRLSNREYQVLQLVADGLPNQAIAESLFVSVETVRTHIKSVLRKLEARDRAHAVAVAFRTGLLAAQDERARIPVAR